jgi:hypothetical protein
LVDQQQDDGMRIVVMAIPAALQVIAEVCGLMFAANISPLGLNRQGYE